MQGSELGPTKNPDKYETQFFSNIWSIMYVQPFCRIIMEFRDAFCINFMTWNCEEKFIDIPLNTKFYFIFLILVTFYWSFASSLFCSSLIKALTFLRPCLSIRSISDKLLGQWLLFHVLNVDFEIENLTVLRWN